MKKTDKKKLMVITLIIGIILIGMAGYLYYSQNTEKGKGKQTASNTITEEDDINSPQKDNEAEKEKDTTDNKTVTEVTTQKIPATTEKKKNPPLPDNYEWDEKRWGEPPQIIYDFAENQEKFDFIVTEVDSILVDEDGFSTWRENGKIIYDSEYENQLSDELKKEIEYLLNHTKFYDFTKYKDGNWVMEYDQEEDREKYIYYMTYVPKLTEEQAWDEGYIKVVGDWYFTTLWKV